MSRADPFPNYRFYVEIGSQKQAVFTELSGLNLEMDVTEYSEGGNNEYVHRLPGRTRVSNLLLKRGMTVSNDFFQWYVQLAQGQVTRQNISVVMYDVGGNEVRRFNFINAYPVKWIGPQFTASGNMAAIESLELAHDGMSLE